MSKKSYLRCLNVILFVTGLLLVAGLTCFITYGFSGWVAVAFVGFIAGVVVFVSMYRHPESFLDGDDDD